jgi:hypothetical protein
VTRVSIILNGFLGASLLLALIGQAIHLWRERRGRR